jgi:hypothetical protein
LSTVVSCKKESKPQGILSHAQMVDWMIAVYLAEARVQLLSLPIDSAYKIFRPYQDSLMRQKSLQDSVLRKSYQYYLRNSVELEAIYDTVIDSLSLREQLLRQTPAPTIETK